MRIVFFGTPDLAVPTMDALHHYHEVVAVVCQPDRPQGRSSKLVAPPAKVWAEAHGIPVHQPKKLNDGTFEAWLREQQPELCVLVAYGRILKEPILEVPPNGFLNLHPSLLPLYRGPSPIQSAVLHGEATTGLTIMRLTMEVDAGDILLQEEVDIDEDDTTASLTERLSGLGANLMLRAVDLVEQEEAVFTPQDHGRATYTSIISKQDGAISWKKPAEQIHNLVRASIPWPVAYCGHGDKVVRIHRTQVHQIPCVAPPGTITEIGLDSITVATGEGHLVIFELQMPGKRAMAVSDFLRGHAWDVGESLEDG